jgi:hypothetical protein
MVRSRTQPAADGVDDLPVGAPDAALECAVQNRDDRLTREDLDRLDPVDHAHLRERRAQLGAGEGIQGRALPDERLPHVLVERDDRRALALPKPGVNVVEPHARPLAQLLDAELPVQHVGEQLPLRGAAPGEWLRACGDARRFRVLHVFTFE